ncbi:sigma-70 family RNA polymerase sigma factor [Exilibacterium tricleocarpae]|uniref:Sigma-70 family RNA polymerase sigma factor n=1 Tax=Exilibacterium tricleocarpae TaxID=2591008 RepID=A0A545UBJ9_9GAMM|nr:sigma-70 family RNA polymerase sigma factor [Exilibacterium tricleocarpae]TQV86803.1 sigma-70 family RNA polymerase sigma factor [Exilibacterium tricleocarpae]
MTKVSSKGKLPAGACTAAPEVLTFDELYRHFWQELCAHVRRTFGPGPPDPEDVAQAAFTRYVSLDDPDAVLNPRAFLFTTARNIVLDQKRKDKSHLKYAQSVLAQSSELKLDELSPERVLLEKRRFDRVRRAIDRLPHKQKVVLSLHRYRGYTFKQITEETGWSYGDVYRQLDTALATLARALKQIS